MTPLDKMRSKLIGILIVFAIFGAASGVSAQIVTEQPTEGQNLYLDSLNQRAEIENDSLLKIVRTDTACIAEQSFNEDFTQKYANNSDFDYERGGGGKSFMEKLRDWFNELLRKLLGRDELHNFNDYSELVLNILFALVFLAAVYVIVRLIMNHKGRWFLARKNEKTEINLDNVEEHIHEADFETLIRQTEQQGNTRQSVRLYYLWLLKTFADKEIIEWNPEKTNADYVREIADEGRKETFRYLSYLYNYIWYGEFSISDNEYQQARRAFVNQLNPNGK